MVEKEKTTVRVMNAKNDMSNKHRNGPIRGNSRYAEDAQVLAGRIHPRTFPCALHLEKHNFTKRSSETARRSRRKTQKEGRKNRAG